MISNWRVKSMRFLLTTVILSMLAQPVWAQSVWMMTSA